MKLFKILFLVTCLFLSSCSEGDIIDIDIDFEGELQNCSNENDNTFVFFKNDLAINRSLSVNFVNTTFSINPETVADISVDAPTEILLNTTTNQFIYREFDAPINDINYFCSSIPVSDILVTKELVSSNGTAEISYAIVDNSSTEETIYSRTVTLRNITLLGEGVEFIQEELVLGTDTVTLTN